MSRPYRKPAPRTSFLADGTWLEPEEIAYHGGASSGRRARAICPDGVLRVFRIGLPDTFFSIPVKGGGFVSMQDGAAHYTP